MLFDVLILKYLEITDYSMWSFAGTLKYLAENVNYTSANLPEIKEAFCQHMQNRSTSCAFYKSVQRKAQKLCSNITLTLERPEIKKILKDQDIKNAREMYDKSVEFSVITDKSTKIEMCSKSYETFLRSGLNEDKENISDDNTKEDSDNNDVVIHETLTSSNSRLEKNSGYTLKHGHDDLDMTSASDAANKRSRIEAKNLLDESKYCSEEMLNLLRNFQTYCDHANNILTADDIMDLRPSSEFVLKFTDEADYSKLLKDVFDPIDQLFPEEAFEFLVEFFAEKLNDQQWQDKIETLINPETDQFFKQLKRFMFETLPIFFDSYAMNAENPLKNQEMEEDEYMNNYIHPILKKALARFSNIRYVPGNKAIEASAYRKSVTNQKGNADRSDGIVYTSNEKPYEICVIEGSKPYNTENGKEMADFLQNARAGKDIINFVITQEVKLKRALPVYFRGFMVHSFELSLRFYFMDYLGRYRIFEIETCEVPTDLTGVRLFPFLYRAVVTWALMIKNADREFQLLRNSKRSSRYSNAHNLRVLMQLSHNQARPGDKKSMKMDKII
ncbi:11452_t:CDS:10 [Funneliformis geosporum]|uniref:11452_t:CDS:1 n=1 Tax=Funneliformis geosporum TaxID=1117311 RepID=A0A9W4SRB2_9GLOM|nr:11452_t:CDS:10 [Funneliformis geosporum]